MAKSLIGLIAELKNQVDQQDDYPTDDQYRQAVVDAVRDLNTRLPYRNEVELSIVSGTAAYTLPADFFRVIRFESPYYDGGGTVITGSGIIPRSKIGKNRDEWFKVFNGTMTLVPTPTYDDTRRLWYQAIHVLDEDDEYPNMDDWWAGIMLIQARSILLSLLAGSLSQSGAGLESYQLGDFRIERGKGIERMREESKRAHEEYIQAVRDAKGVQGQRASYTWADERNLP